MRERRTREGGGGRTKERTELEKVGGRTGERTENLRRKEEEMVREQRTRDRRRN